MFQQFILAVLLKDEQQMEASDMDQMQGPYDCLTRESLENILRVWGILFSFLYLYSVWISYQVILSLREFKLFL